MKNLIDIIKEDPREAIESLIAWSGLFGTVFMLFVIGG